ncbi:MAG: T9SS type A sorting domain-containing protein [Flavobacteriaceae bacterium]|nr:T9SS type A sorting domain-containing protein [Flavobacteriaceae bacterium]
MVIEEINLTTISVNQSDNIVCEGESVTFTVNNPDAIEATYNWSIDGINVGSGTSYTLSNVTVNTTIELIVTSIDGSCTHVATAIVDVLPAPDPAFTYKVSCKGVTNKKIIVTPNQNTDGSMWFIYASNELQEFDINDPLDPNGDDGIQPNANTHWAYGTEFTNLQGQYFVIIHGVWNSECSWTSSTQWINLEAELSLDPGMSIPVVTPQAGGQYLIESTANANPNDRYPTHWWRVFRADVNCNMLDPIAPVSSIVYGNGAQVFEEVLGLGQGCYILKHGIWEEGCSAWQESTHCFCIAGSRQQVEVEEKIFSDFIIYPNPSSDHIYVEFKDNKNGIIEIRDMLGKVIERKSLEKENKIMFDLKSYKTGVYYIFISDERNTAYKKIIKN